MKKSEVTPLELILLAAIILLAAYLRLANVADTPGWFADEGTHILIATQLAQGQQAYMAVGESTLLFAKLPLFDWLLATVWPHGVEGITALRTLTGSLGILTVLTLYGSLHFMTRDRYLALTAAFLLAILPFGIYAIIMLINVPQTFLFDLHYTLTRLSGTSLTHQLKTLAVNYTTLFFQNPWLLLALLGFFQLKSARLQKLTLLLFLLPIIILGRSEALVHLSAYYMIPLLPLIALGAAALVRSGLPIIYQKISLRLHEILARRLPTRLAQNQTPQIARAENHLALLIFTLIFLSPLITAMLFTINQVRTAVYPTEIDPFLIQPHDGRRVAAYINAHADPMDVVITSPGIAWALNNRTADPQMTAAFGGLAPPHLPADIPADRFLFSPDYRSARYVIVDNYWHNWVVFHVPGTTEMLTELESWPQPLQHGAITVYCNPGSEKACPQP